MHRSLQVYCLGPAKAGTHSFAGLFQPLFRTGHEEEKEDLIGHIQAHVAGELDRSEMLAFLRARDQRLALDVDSSVYNFFVKELLAEALPKARFVLLLRDCLSWADSCYNNFSAGITPQEEMPFWDYWFEAERYTHAPQERVLEDRGLYPLRCLLDAWTRAIQTTLDGLSEERRLLVRTRELRQELPRIAAFAGTDVEKLNPGNSHLFKARRKFGLLAKLDGSFLAKTAEAACGDLMRIYFPEKPPLEWAFDDETLRSKTKDTIFARLGAALRDSDPSRGIA